MTFFVNLLKENAFICLNGREENRLKENFVMTLTTTIMPLLLLSFVVVNSLSDLVIHEGFAQSTTGSPNHGSQPFKVIVGVTNNAADNKVGSIHLMVDGTTIVKNLNGVLFPAKQTMTFPIEIDANKVTAGNEYTIEVIYGDDFSKRIHDSISGQQANSPQIINIAIP